MDELKVVGEEGEGAIVTPTSPLPRKASRRLKLMTSNIWFRQRKSLERVWLTLFQVKYGDCSPDVPRKWDGRRDSPL